MLFYAYYIKRSDFMSVKCPSVIQKEEGWYVATDVVSGVASQGKSIDELFREVFRCSAGL